MERGFQQDSARGENPQYKKPLTRIGAHNASLNHAVELGTQVARTILKEAKIKAGLERAHNPELEALRRFRETGGEVIIATRWPKDFGSAAEALDAGHTRRDSHPESYSAWAGS